MKKEIAKNAFYEAYVDEEINRMYWVMRGQWKKLSDIPDYRKHNMETLSYLKPGFTALIDLRDMEVPGTEILGSLTETTKEVEEAGVGRLAQIVDKKSLEAIRTGRGVIKESGMDVKMMQFGSYEEAIEWLDR